MDESGLLGDAQVGTDATIEGAAPDATPDAFSGDANAADGGIDAAVDAVADVEAGLCACLPNQTCCVYVSNNTIAQIACATVCDAPDGGVKLSELACTGSDCADAGVCCIWRDSNSVNHSVCKAKCSNSNNEVQMCNPSATDSGCPPSDPCSTNNITDWDLTPPLATCGGQGVP